MGPKNFNKTAFLENQWVEMRWMEDIIHFTCKQNIIVDTPAAQGIHDDMILFANGRKVAAFVDFRGVKYFSITAMSLVSTKNYISQYKGLAILLGSYPQIIIGNFFLHIYKQNIPIKMFYDKDNAIKWIMAINAKAN